jgi:hypothetical protein
MGWHICHHRLHFGIIVLQSVCKNVRHVLEILVVLDLIDRHIIVRFLFTGFLAVFFSKFGEVFLHELLVRLEFLRLRSQRLDQVIHIQDNLLEHQNREKETTNIR